MKINLRKASVIQDALKTELNMLRTGDGSTFINIFDADVEGHIQKSQSYIMMKIDKIRRYSDARRYLRAVVARLNVEAGITDLLAEEATLDSMETMLSDIAQSTPRLSPETLQRQIDSMLKASDRYPHSLSVNVLTKESIDAIERELTSLKHRRRQLKDRMVAINVKTEFQLPPNVESALKELGLVGAPDEEAVG